MSAEKPPDDLDLIMGLGALWDDESRREPYYQELQALERVSKRLPLLKAAPDLLEAAKLLQAALTEYRLRDVKKRYSLCVADAAASKAIAKAEGLT